MTETQKMSNQENKEPINEKRRKKVVGTICFICRKKIDSVDWEKNNFAYHVGKERYIHSGSCINSIQNYPQKWDFEEWERLGE